jgi:hypothetical protein
MFKKLNPYQFSSALVMGTVMGVIKKRLTEMVRRYRTFYESERLRRKQWEVSVYKRVVHCGHAKEIGIEYGRCRGCSKYGSRFSQREHALDRDGTRAAEFNGVRVGGT